MRSKHMNIALAAAGIAAAGGALREEHGGIDIALAVGAYGAPPPPPSLAPPDRLSVDIASPYFDDCYKRVGVRVDGVERRGDVQEYCMSEGWVMIRERNAHGKFRLDKDGGYVLTRLFGAVVAYFKDGRPTRKSAPAFRQTAEQASAHLSAAEAKRQRKAAKLREEGL